MIASPSARVLLPFAAVAALMAFRQAPGRGALTATLTPLLESTGVHPGGTIRGALDVHLPEGYHAQSNHPRDPAAIPTRLSFEPAAGLSVVEEVFPPTTDVRLLGFDQPQPVFERDFAVGVQFVADADLAPGDRPVRGILHYQACNDRQCLVPVNVTTTWTIHVVPAASAIASTPNPVFGQIAYGTGQPPPKPTSADRTSRPAPTGSTAPDLTGLARLDQFDVLDTSSGYQSAGDFLQFVHDAEHGTKPRGLFEGRGPLAILLLVFVGGIALNLTPCVLPMIPINLAIIGAGTRAGDRRRGLWLGGTYGAAMAVVYGLLGVVVVLTAGSFGTINASPWFNLIIALIFVVLGLAMFDVITIDFSRFSSRIHFKSESRGTFLLAFGMGAVAALLAGACVAPVVVQVVIFSSGLYAAGTTVALALPFVLGLGMAAPWPVAGAGLAFLPKPGKWMERVKYAFGIFILATAAYYGYEAWQIFSNRWVDPAAVEASVAAQLKNGWQPSLADGLDEALKTGKPVVIDMWATWCKNCLVMDTTTLADPQVKDALAGYVRIKLQAEDPTVSPAKDLLTRFSSPGLPTYAILRPKAPATPR